MGTGLDQGWFGVQDFFDAIMTGNIGHIRLGLEKGWANRSNGRGELPVFVAIRSSRPESLRELLSTVDALKPNEDGVTPLSAAAANCNMAMLGMIAPRASMAETFGPGQNALLMCLKFGWVDSALLLAKRLAEDLCEGAAHGQFLWEAMTDFSASASRNARGNEAVEKKVIETVSILMRATNLGDDGAFAMEAQRAAAKASALGESILGPMVAAYELSLRETREISASLAPSTDGALAAAPRARL